MRWLAHNISRNKEAFGEKSKGEELEYFDAVQQYFQATQCLQSLPVSSKEAQQNA